MVRKATLSVNGYAISETKCLKTDYQVAHFNNPQYCFLEICIVMVKLSYWTSSSLGLLINFKSILELYSVGKNVHFQHTTWLPFFKQEALCFLSKDQVLALLHGTPWEPLD